MLDVFAGGLDGGDAQSGGRALEEMPERGELREILALAVGKEGGLLYSIRGDGGRDVQSVIHIHERSTGLGKVRLGHAEGEVMRVIFIEIKDLGERFEVYNILLVNLDRNDTP